jgi:putative peptidoglycan lipid II flippase
VSAILNAWLLYRGLRRDRVLRHSPGWSKLLRQVSAGLLLMGLCLAYMEKPLTWWIEASVAGRLRWLAASVFAGVVVYVAALLILGLRPANLRLRSS